MGTRPPGARTASVTAPAPHGPTRRSALKAALLGVGAACGVPLAGCSAGGGSEIRFLMNKPEVVGYFRQLVDDFNASQQDVRVVLDTTPTSITAQFVREAPPDLACYNYNLEAANFVRRDVLTDLADVPAAQQIAPDVQELVGQFAGSGDQTSVLPFSVTAAGVIYNQALFDQVGVEIPTTWAELLAACETFAAAGVTPLYSTYRETWTIQQGLFDYCTGGMVDVAGFYADLQEVGTDFEPGGPQSFTQVMGPAVDRMLELAAWSNDDAASRTYYDGNLAFGQGRAAMYLQGPWALGEIAKVDPDLPVGTFALPMTDDPDERRVRVNLDLALWIPRSTPSPDAARTFLEHLMSPEIVNTYNTENQAYSPLVDAPDQPDPRVAGLQPYVDAGRFYQGAGTYIPPTVPLGNYLQEAVLSGDGEAFLETLDADWQRLALRSA
ncbi:ABC transporter substrate-binding protein [Thalassiella azotivora]